MYANHPHWPSQNRPRYQDDDEAYYSPNAYQRPQQTAPPPRRRPNTVQQDPTHLHFYPRHRDDHDGWPTPSLPPDSTPPQPPRRQPTTTTNSTSDYSTRPRSRCGRSASVTRGTRSKSTSPRRHAASLSAPSIPQPSVNEREALVRQRLRTTFETYVFNTLPTHLLRITDMTLLTRNEIWDIFRPRIESLSDSHLARLLLEQDEEARKLGVSVLDPEVLAPFTEYIRTMFGFAIFSHKRSNTSESLFQELVGRRVQAAAKKPAPAGPEYQKLTRFCEKARTDYGCEYVWADTCCINRESGAEIEEVTLSTSLWYSEARICIVHLANSSTLEDLASDPWVTTSWTLPELLFARKIRFYGKDWSPICPAVVEGRREERAGRENREEQRINDKDNESVVTALTEATGIPGADIRNFVPSCARVSEKMKWISQRTTCRIEDTAYSMLAIFDVTIPIAYGEGLRAFHKLMTAITEQYTEPDLFAWNGKPSQWSLALPSSPQCYGEQAPQSDYSSSALGDPMYELTKLGLRIRLVMVPAYCEPLEPTDVHSARFFLAPALPTQDPIQVYVPHVHEHDPRETHGRGREYALGVVDYDTRAGPPGYAALHAGWAHLCLVLERERRGRGWLRVARPGAVNVRFRESELLQVESVCLLHKA